MDRSEIVLACDRVLSDLRSDPRFGHTTHLLVIIDGRPVVDEHLHGPVVGDVFSVTKSILATVLAVMASRGLLPDLDRPMSEVLAGLRGLPAETHTWRDVLTMTRGARVDGPWEFDEVAALAGGQVARIASAPQLTPPGTKFDYDDCGPHLVSAATAEILGESVGDFAARELFGPLGLGDVRWPADPDGVSWGSAGVAMSARDLGRLGELWLAGGSIAGRRLLEPGFFAAMTTLQSAGGPPENVPYGFLTWLPPDLIMAGGWAGQHLLVVPRARAVVVSTGDPGFSLGPPASDRLPPDWQPALTLIREHLLPVLLGRAALTSAGPRDSTPGTARRAAEPGTAPPAAPRPSADLPRPTA